MKFEEDFFNLLRKLKQNEHFAYTRFSDGEICVMQDKELKLADDHVVMGETRYGFGYSAEAKLKSMLVNQLIASSKKIKRHLLCCKN